MGCRHMFTHDGDRVFLFGTFLGALKLFSYDDPAGLIRTRPVVVRAAALCRRRCVDCGTCFGLSLAGSHTSSVAAGASAASAGFEEPFALAIV